MNASPHWTAVVSALAIAIVAVFGAYIAWNQWKTNHNMLRERLFDRRFGLFESTQEIIAGIVEDGRLSWETANRFSEISQRARFMFSSEDAQYFELLRSKAMELATVTSMTGNKMPSQAKNAREEQRDLCDWFNDQVEEVFSRMSKYLLFDK